MLSTRSGTYMPQPVIAARGICNGLLHQPACYSPAWALDASRATSSRADRTIAGSVVLAAPLLDLDLHDLTTSVIPTMRADMMLTLDLAALRAHHHGWRLDLVMLAMKTLLGLSSSLFWKRTHSIRPLTC